MKNVVNLLQEWSIPLIAGVFISLLVANAAPHTYHVLVHEPIPNWLSALNGSPAHGEGHGDAAGHGVSAAVSHEGGGHEAGAHGVASAAAHGDEAHGEHGGLSHYLTLHFLINDIFMVLFFGIAAKEIVESCLPGGALNPVRKAFNPLLGTIGGVLGPIGAFILLNLTIGAPDWSRGWGIPTATDIALAWLVARVVFGAGHPAISFLLLLAVADDAIGLGIIAFGYPDPLRPTMWGNTWWIIPGMGIALLFRLLKVQKWWPYIFVGGAFTWWGLYSAALHPALALVPIVPFLPHGKKDLGLYVVEADYEAQEAAHHHSPLESFEHHLKLPVDFGLFFFAFANAGVAFSTLSNLTWVVLLSLLLGKVIGITGFSWAGTKLGCPLPNGMALKHLFVASVIAGIGLTVALFVAGQAFKVDMDSQSAAKMGALMSGGITILAVALGRALRVKDAGEAVTAVTPAEESPVGMNTPAAGTM